MEHLETTTTERLGRIHRSYRMPIDIAGRVQQLAERHGVSEARIVELYLGNALGLREFPPAIRPIIPQNAENSPSEVDFS